MNKFLKKKAPDALITNDELFSSRPLDQPSPTSPGLKKSNTSRWRKNKKQQDTKPQIDLAAVLPPTDDFRTSLLMPKLSARFSMLREQDDPNSILGKASDDSVLQPRRHSRMMDFGFGGAGLSDIAEVSSLSGSIRPPYAAPFYRKNSYVSEEGYGSDADVTPGGSVMTRARPGEGNVLFGGRQKVYKISANSSSRSLGKAVYEDDIGISAFQRYRRERAAEEQPLSADQMGFDFGLDNVDLGPGKASYESSTKDRADSPSLSTYDKKRSTASSSEDRSSTAATSITSPSLASAAPSPLLPATQSVTAATQAQAFERSNTKARRLYEQGLDQHTQDQQTSALTRLNSLQRQRAGTKQLHSVKSASNLHDRPPQPVYALRAQSPSNLPSQPSRTLGSVKGAQVQGSSPNPSVPGSPESAAYDRDVLSRALEPADRGKATALGAFTKPQQAFDEQQYVERQMQLQRSNSNAVGHQPVQSRIGRFEQDAQRGSSDTSRTPSQSSTRKPEPAKTAPQPSKPAATASKTKLPDTHRTFFGDISASDSEDDEEPHSQHAFSAPDYSYGIYHGKWQPTVLPSVSEHPALRHQRSKPAITEEEEELEPAPLRTKTSGAPLINTIVKNVSASESVDSPTLGIGAQPLNGMLRHLRQRSAQSSIYPADETAADDGGHDLLWDSSRPALANALDNASRHDSTYTSSNPWDLDDSDLAAMSKHNSGAQDEVEPDGGAEPLSWRNELHRQHNREASSATQQERDAFANELAARRNAIQESMKRQAERREVESRGVSPARSVASPFKALGMMRTKSSRETLANSRDAPSKAQKALGMASANPSSTSISSSYDKSGYSLDSSRSQTDSPPVPPLPNNAQHPAFQPAGLRDGDQSRQHPATRSMASSQTSPGRSRSNSTTTSGRSRSRTGPYRDDLERAMVEGTGSSTAMHSDVAFALPRDITPRASPDVGFIGADSSRSAMTNYFEPKAPLSVQTTASARLNVQGPSPIGYSPNGVSPISLASATPPVSNGSTPAVSPGVAVSSRPANMPRRKTISKSDISTPKLISSTSNVDTVDLPEGASLMNGMESPPPIPPINPRRRGTRKFFGIGRQDSGEDRSTASSEHSHSHASSRDFDSHGHPMPVYQSFSHPSSPERMQRNGTPQGASLNAAMI